MNEAELIQHYWNAVENGMTTILLYVSVFTGYLVMAYLVGKRLTILHCLIATGAFLVFSAFCIWGCIVFWNAAYVVATKVHATSPEILPIDQNPMFLTSALLAIGVLGALKFMWDTRHPKTE